jgi:hypothetical protein
MRTFAREDGSLYQFTPVLEGGYRMLYWGSDQKVQSAHLSIAYSTKLMDHLEADPDWNELHCV